jgi:hypothetical protein
MNKKKVIPSLLLGLLVLVSCQNPFARPGYTVDFLVSFELAPTMDGGDSSRFLTPDTESINVTLYFNGGVAFTGNKTLTSIDRSRGEVGFGVSNMPAGPGYTLIVQGLNAGDIVASGWAQFALEPGKNNLIEVGMLPNSYRIRPLVSGLGFNDAMDANDLYKIYRAKMRGGTFAVSFDDSPFNMAFYDAYGRKIPSSRYYFDGESELIFEDMPAGDYYIVVHNPSGVTGSPYIRVSDYGTAPFPSITVDTSAFSFADPETRPTVVGLLGAPMELNFYGEGWELSFTDMIVKVADASGKAVFTNEDFNLNPGKYDEYAIFILDDVRGTYDPGALDFTMSDFNPTVYGSQGQFQGGIDRLGFYVRRQAPSNPTNYEVSFANILGLDPFQFDNGGYYYLDFIDGITVTYGDTVALSPSGLRPYTEVEPNDSPSTANTLQLGQVIVDRIVGQLFSGDSDFFRFQAPADGDYIITLASFFDGPGNVFGGPDNVDINIWSVNADPMQEEPSIYGDAPNEPYEHFVTLAEGDRVLFEISHGGFDTSYSVFVTLVEEPQ